MEQEKQPLTPEEKKKFTHQVIFKDGTSEFCTADNVREVMAKGEVQEVIEFKEEKEEE